MCDNKESLINDILQNVDENTQAELMKIVQSVLQKYAPQSAQDYNTYIQDMSHNSDTSQTSSVELQTTIEKLESEKKRLMKNINELE